MLDLPALIKAKRAAGRDKDIEALKELESLLEADSPPISHERVRAASGEPHVLLQMTRGPCSQR
jgi:hypothetical protein